MAAETDPAEKAWIEQAIRAHKGRIQGLERTDLQVGKKRAWPLLEAGLFCCFAFVE